MMPVVTMDIRNSNPLFPFREVAPRIFETPRLALRAVSLGDLQLIFDVYAGDPVATRYMAWPRAETPESARPFWEMVEASFRGDPRGGVEFVWLIRLKATGGYIGSCGIGTHSGRGLAGGYILNPAFWGKGYAVEAWAPVVAWAKTQPEVERIEATHHPDNPASGAVLRKVGLLLEETARQGGRYPNISGEAPADEAAYAWVRGEEELA